MIIRKSDRRRHENSGNCVAYEYPFGEKDISLAFVEIKGRYSDRGVVANKRVKELFFVTDGTGKVTVDGKEHQISKGDAVLVLPGQKYFFRGRLKLVVSYAPAWTPKQHKNLADL